MLLAARRESKPYGILLVVMSWVLVAAVGILLVMTRSSAGSASSNSASPGASSGSLPTDYSKPFGDDEVRATLAGAQAAVGFQIPMPANAQADHANLMRVWVSGSRTQTALVFNKGKVTIMMARAIYRDPATFLSKFRAGLNAKTAIIRVNQRPTLVIWPHTNGRNPNPAWVEFNRNGIDINIVSTTYNTRALIEIAASI